MCFNLRVFVFITGVISLGKLQTTRHDEYLGPRPSKKFYFPWMVTFHHVTPSTREFFGTGSILTTKYVLASMDCFIRRQRGGRRLPFYLFVDQIHVVAGGLWAETYTSGEDLPSWLELRRIESLRMFSSPDSKVSYGLIFTDFDIPYELSTVEKSPFGFSMSIALIKMKKFSDDGTAIDGFPYKKVILPIPLNFGSSKSDEVGDALAKEFEILDQDPFGLQCYVGGWRTGDTKLLQYQVIYVPFQQCETIFCANDPRACSHWPVKGVHVCFKSLTFTDLCWRDQGSALYCEQFSDSVIAILTSAPTCGYGGLPGVYTLINHGLDLLERYHDRGEWYKPVPKVDLLTKYAPPKNQKDLIPSYDY